MFGSPCLLLRAQSAPRFDFEIGSLSERSEQSKDSRFLFHQEECRMRETERRLGTTEQFQRAASLLAESHDAAQIGENHGGTLKVSIAIRQAGRFANIVDGELSTRL